MVEKGGRTSELGLVLEGHCGVLLELLDGWKSYLALVDLGFGFFIV